MLFKLVPVQRRDMHLSLLFLEKYPAPVLPAMGIFSTSVINGLSGGCTVTMFALRSVFYGSHPCSHAQTIAAEVQCFSLRSPEPLCLRVLTLSLMKWVNLQGSSKTQRFQIIVPQTVFSFIKGVYNLLYFVFLCEEIRYTFLKAPSSAPHRQGAHMSHFAWDSPK